MKTRIPSNWRPLSRALSAFLIAIAALCAMAENAHAQLYVTNVPLFAPGVMSEYDAKTGDVINPNLKTGLNFPEQLVVKERTHSSSRTLSAERLANTTPPPEPRLTPAFRKVAPVFAARITISVIICMR
jgi:hypothetical protein